MQQILNVWTSLESRKRVIVVLATVAMFAAVLSLTRMASAPSMSLLYSGLESGAAGDVVRSLEQRGVKYQVRGGSIYVESANRDELRMTLASEGLPANTNKGYELLDSLSGFGTTSQMFDAAYWRAKEGELARTIVGSPKISSARVHIANTGSNPFQRNVHASASVAITTTGGGIGADHVRALKYLVASAVSGLAPEDVAVIDGVGGLMSAADEAAPAAGVDDRADKLRERVQRLLEARVGYGNAVVEVSVETNTESESISERLFDPEKRVAISTDTEERTTNSKDSGGGDVTIASNLPDGDAGAANSSSSQNSETRERVNYEVSETLREITREAGAVKRLSVAVLVNGTQTEGADGVVSVTPRSDEELAALRELVSSAVGFNAERGDVITLKSMSFEPVVPAGTEANTSMLGGMALDLMSIIQMAVVALVALILGLFVVKPIITAPSTEMAALPVPTGGGDADFEGASEDTALSGEIDTGDGPMPAIADFGGFAPMGDGGLPELGMGGMSEDPVDRLRSLIGERQEETVEILRSWMEEREESA